MRDENGFKCHVASESHVRQMQLIGEDPRKAINDFSNQFLKDFIQLLRTGHGEKKVNVNHFYQEYISNKQHIHMNATRWNSLTEFAKYLGREGLCRVDEDEKNEGRAGASGLMISWIDNSPEALRRQEAARKRERQDRGDEEREQRLIEAQIRKAKRQIGDDDAEEGEQQDADETQNNGQGIKRKDGEKIVLNFGAKKAVPEVSKPPTPPLSEKEGSPSDKEKYDAATPAAQASPETTPSEPTENKPAQPPAKQPISMSFGSSASKPKNVFAAASKKNALGGSGKTSGVTTQRPMSEAERIMKQEIEWKRTRDAHGAKSGNVFKKQRVS
jgi:DNA/RNA-binding protein KIN17